MIHSMRFQYGAFFIAVFAAILGFIVLGYLPKLDRIQKLQAQETELQQQLDARLEMNKRVDRLSTEQLDAVERVTETVLKQIPQEHKTADLLAQLSAMTDRQGIVNVKFTAGERAEFFTLELPDEQGRELHFRGHRLPLTLEFTAEFAKVTSLLLEFERLDRIIVSTGLDMRHEDGLAATTLDLLVFSLQAEGAGVN